MRNLRPTEVLGLFGSLISSGRLLVRTPRWDPERIRRWQFQRVQSLVRHAWDRVPFYRDLYQSAGFQPGDLKTWEDFQRLPVVTKDQVIAAYPDRMVARGYNLGDLVVSRSSGSSGKVLDIAYDGRAMNTFILAGLRLYRMGFNYLPWHRLLYIYTSPYPLNSLTGLYPMHFISTLALVEEITAEWLRLDPALVVCYPSHLKQVARALNREQMSRLHPRAISVNSEMSTQTERDEMSRLFGCPVLDEYSSEELTRIAAQCVHLTYHVFEDINYMEVVDEEGRPAQGPGVLVGTNLHNKAMPMIRYLQNDLGFIETADCACGRRFRALKVLQGRKNDSFLLPSGRLLSSGFLLDATYEFLLEYRTAVLDFCLIQLRSEAVLLEIVPGPGWNADVKASIGSRFRGFLEDGVVFNIEEVKECRKTGSGKRNPIISLVNRPATI